MTEPAFAVGRASGAPVGERHSHRPQRLGQSSWLVRLLPAALLTCTIAVYNHFPLTYPDTGNYLQNASAVLHGRTPWFFYRPVVYGVFLTPFATAWTIWLVPVAQGLLVAFVVDLSLNAAGVSLGTGTFIALFAGLSTLTSLPWFSGQIMPDIFTSFVILLCFVAVLGKRQTPRRQVLVAVLSAFAVGCHLSHFPLYVLLAVTVLAVRMVVDDSFRSWHRILPVAARATAPVVAAAGLLIVSNYGVRREPVLSRSSSLFALANLVDKGLAQPYLDQACPVRRYRICSEPGPIQPDLDWFLWAPDGPWQRDQPELARGDSTFLRETSAIVAGTLRQEWPAVLRTSLRRSAIQLVTIGHHPTEFAFSPSVEKGLAPLGAGPLHAYMGSRQVREGLPVDMATRIQYVVVGLSLLVLLGCWRALRGRPHAALRALITTVCLGVVFNALVVGSLATVHPRYQSRVIWLVPLLAAVALYEAVGARARRS